MNRPPTTTRAQWSAVQFLFFVAAAFCVFCVSVGVVVLVFGGFVLLIFRNYVAFALMVAVPSLVLSLFAALIVAEPAGFPPPIGDLVVHAIDSKE
jgi:hypothetical protein